MEPQKQLGPAPDKEIAFWGSHIPALMSCVAGSRGDVLEIGIGHYSTPALHAVCASMGKRLVSVEADKNWALAFSGVFATSRHEFITGPYDKVLPAFAQKDWGVVFIDHSPGGENRAKAFRMFIDGSTFTVVHDYHHENQEAIDDRLASVRFKIVIDMYQPPTLVASKYADPSWLDALAGFWKKG